jgi:hypothetical protein
MKDSQMLDPDAGRRALGLPRLPSSAQPQQEALIMEETKQTEITASPKKTLGQHLRSAFKYLRQGARWLFYGSREHQKYKERQLILAERQVLCALIGTVVIVIPIVYGLIGVVNSINFLRSDAKQSQFEISFPANNAEVGLGQQVRGHTPYLDRKHYIVVTTMSNGSQQIQKEPAPVSPDGSFSGEARFGTATNGQDDEYKIQVFATRASGPLSSIPADAIFAPEPVNVRRSLPVEPQVVITVPKPGAEVFGDDSILGETLAPGLNHYIVVTPIRTGTPAVQDQPARVSPDGTFTGRARFGGANVGVGEQFSVYVIATEARLAAGPLPDNTQGTLSNSVTVTRTK